jgi:hypothetical protein
MAASGKRVCRPGSDVDGGEVDGDGVDGDDVGVGDVGGGIMLMTWVVVTQ